MKNTFFYSTPVGYLHICDNGEKITKIYVNRNMNKEIEYTESKLIKETFHQIDEYFHCKRINFDIPLHYEGTAFQEKVWRALQEIPYGETATYSEIAKRIDNPKACRAVGGANNKNPIMIIIPCHRVIGANGSLVGFGAGLDAKTYLLDIEHQGK